MKFEKAIEAVTERGALAGRIKWNGAFVYLVQGSRFTTTRPPLNEFVPSGTEVSYHPHIDMRHVDGSFSVWTPTQEDILADDWVIYNRDDILESQATILLEEN